MSGIAKPIRSQQIRRRNNMMEELAEMLVTALEKHGITKEAAENEAEEIAFQIHRRWSGLTFCFPKDNEVAKKRLEYRIAQQYDGTNADILVREYGVTESYIYKAVKRCAQNDRQ